MLERMVEYFRNITKVGVGAGALMLDTREMSEIVNDFDVMVANSKKLNQDDQPSSRVWAPVTDLKELQPGDQVRHFGNPRNFYSVTMNYGTRVTAVRSVDLTNPAEWMVLRRAKK